MQQQQTHSPLINRNHHVPPNWVAVCIDESEYCDSEFLARCGGKVYGVYLVDTNSITYCCSPVKTYCLNLVDTVPERAPEDPEEAERLWEELRECTHNSPHVMYVECRVIDNLPEDHKAAQSTPEEWAEDEDRGFEEVREAYCGNPDF